MKIIVYSDELLNGNEHGSSKVGLLIFLADKNNNGNVNDYGSIKSSRVVRSVLGAKSYGSADEFDDANIIKEYQKAMFKKIFNITILTESATKFNVVICNESSNEKRLMMDVKIGVEAYNDKTIDDIIWIRRRFHFAEELCKSTIVQ